MSTKKRITLEELQSKEMPEEAKIRIRSAVSVYDEDNPPMTKEELETLRPVAPDIRNGSNPERQMSTSRSISMSWKPSKPRERAIGLV